MRGSSRSWGRRRSSGRAATRRCGNSWRRRDRSRAVLRPQLPGSLGPRGPASLPGGDLNGDRHRHRHPARRRPDPPASVARARARLGQRVPDDPEPGALRLPDPPAAHRGDRGHDGDRRAGGVRLAADRAEHLHGDRRRRSRGARGGPRYGDDRLAALDARRAAARLRGDARRGAGGDGGERGDGDDRRRDRRGRFGRVHLPRRGDGERHVDSRGRGPGRADGARGGRVARAGGTAIRVASAVSDARGSRVTRAESPGSAGGAPCKGAPRAERALSGRGSHAGTTLVRSLSLLLFIFASCAGRDRIVVGSKNFTESDLLGEIVAQQIERRTSLPVERRFHLGGTFVCHAAITAGHSDPDVEETGTGGTAVVELPPLPARDGVAPRLARALAQTLRLGAGTWTGGQRGGRPRGVGDDDRHYFPPYEAAPVMRQAVVGRHPEIAAALGQLAGGISDAEMRRLNALADVEHQDIATIARDWLARNVP